MIDIDEEEFRELLLEVAFLRELKSDRVDEWEGFEYVSRKSVNETYEELVEEYIK